MGIKVMLVYPNFRGMNMLPPAIGLLSAVLKNAGHTVRLYDTTYYEEIDGNNFDSDTSKADRLMARPYEMPREISMKRTNCYEDFKKEVEEFGPDLLALSATEDMFELGVRLLQTVRDQKILTIAGGVFPTFATKLALSFPEIDIVCKGEGEDALLELCNRLQRGEDYSNVNNLWIKQKDGSIKGNPTRIVDMDKNPLIDMTIFEEARFYRPMGGKVYRMFPVETHRGCPYTCAFCNSPSQVAMYKKEGNQSYLRKKSFENMRRELLFYKEEMKAEYLYFWADTFFSWRDQEFDEFCEIYKDIKLPFWCQTRVETVKRDRFEKLRDIGCARISFGLEHGNEEYRKKVLRRAMPNSLITNNLNIVKDVGIPFSVNNIIGFPQETYELAFDTIRLNRTFEADDRNAYSFTPFAGTPLRDEAEKLGLIDKNTIVRCLLTSGTALNMPQFPSHKINGLCKTFNMYVRFPESRWPEIKRAEEDTPEGQRIYEELKGEFVEKFFDPTNESIEAASSNVI
jgi:anaerobic magnesium-protoporphyrin IX monomethyl ester cyclase